MKRLILALALLAAVGCASNADKQYYVESTGQGYYATVNTWALFTPSVRVSGPFKTPQEADDVVRKLNSSVIRWADEKE